MRYVHPNDMVAHLWANQSQESARSANGNFHFRDQTIYSYGGHFPIARLISNDRGERAVLFTSRGYSPTTSHHKSLVSRAIPQGLPVWSVTFPDRVDPQTCLNCTLGHYRETLSKAKAARASGNRPWLLGKAKELSEQYVALGRFWSIPAEPLWSDDWEATYQQIKAAEAAAIAEREKRERERIERRERELAEQLEQWVAGADVSPPHTRDLRLRVTGDELQTSWGARVPLCDAIRVFRVAAICRANKRPCCDFRQGPCEDAARVGDFQVDHIDEYGTIRAGCHLIGWSESERVAQSLGLIPAGAAHA